MVACISRSLNKHERNYSSYEGQMLAAVWAIKLFRPYLMWVPFQLVTDHQPLKRHNSELGVTHQNADVLSRLLI
jgi:hypothetical protein